MQTLIFIYNKKNTVSDHLTHSSSGHLSSHVWFDDQLSGIVVSIPHSRWSFVTIRLNVSVWYFSYTGHFSVFASVSLWPYSRGWRQGTQCRLILLDKSEGLGSFVGTSLQWNHIINIYMPGRPSIVYKILLRGFKVASRILLVPWLWLVPLFKTSK